MGGVDRVEENHREEGKPIERESISYLAWHSYLRRHVYVYSNGCGSYPLVLCRKPFIYLNIWKFYAQRLRSSVRTSKHFWMSGRIVPYRERGETGRFGWVLFSFILFGMPAGDLFRWPPIPVKVSRSPFSKKILSRHFLFKFKRCPQRRSLPRLTRSSGSHRRPWSYTIE